MKRRMAAIGLALLLAAFFAVPALAWSSLFGSGFETGDFSEWTSYGTTYNAELSVEPYMHMSDCGYAGDESYCMKAWSPTAPSPDIPNGIAYVRDASPDNEAEYSASWLMALYAHLHDTTTANAFVGYNSSNSPIFRVVVNDDGDPPDTYQYNMRVSCLRNNGTWANSDWIPFSTYEAAWVSVYWKANAGGQAGQCNLQITGDETSYAYVAVNTSDRLESVRLGVPGITSYVGNSMRVYADDFNSEVNP